MATEATATMYTIPRDSIPDLIRQRYPNGGERILLVGPPGTGKTALAIAIATGQRAAEKAVLTPTNTVCGWGTCKSQRQDGYKFCAPHLSVLDKIGRKPTPEPIVEADAPVISALAPEDAEARGWCQVTLTSETLESRIWGGLYPNAIGGMDERMGPGLLAWHHGWLWVVNEVHRGSADTHERLINGLDDSKFASDTSPLGTVHRPVARFGCIGTQNAPSTVLSDALRDRFAMRIQVLSPSTAALERLDPDVRLHVERSYAALTPDQWEEGPRPSYRDCLSFCESRAVGMNDETAAALVLDDPNGMQPQAFIEALAILKGELARNTAAGETGSDNVAVQNWPDHDPMAGPVRQNAHGVGYRVTCPCKPCTEARNA